MQEPTKLQTNELLGKFGFDMHGIVHTKPSFQAPLGANLNFAVEDIDPGLLATLNEQDVNLDHFHPDLIDVDAINAMAFASDLSRAFASYEGTQPDPQPTRVDGVDDNRNVPLFDLCQSNFPSVSVCYNNGENLPAQVILDEADLQAARAAAILGARMPVQHSVKQSERLDIPRAFDPMGHVRQPALCKPWPTQREQQLEDLRKLRNHAVQRLQQTTAPAERWATLLGLESYETPCSVQQAQVQSQGDMQSSIQAGRAEGFLFDSLEEAIAAHPSPNWRCPTNDLTIPATDEDRASWVLELLDAINNTINVFDTPGVAFAKRWHHPVTGPSNFYSDENKEIVCWDIVDLAERLHRSGPNVLHSFDKLFWEETNKTQAWTFQQRMKQIVLLLKFSKGRCESLLANETLHAVVGYPGALLSTANNNAKCNRARQAILEAGRAAKKPKLRQ